MNNNEPEFYTVSGRCVRFNSFTVEQTDEITQFLKNDKPNRTGEEYIAYYDDYILATESDEMPPVVVKFLAGLIEDNGGSVNITFAT